MPFRILTPARLERASEFSEREREGARGRERGAEGGRERERVGRGQAGRE